MPTEVETGSISSNTSSSVLRIPDISGGVRHLNVTIWGAFVATVTIQRSFDNTTWHTVAKDADGNPASYTAPISIPVRESESGVYYRLNVTGYSSGTINYRLSR